jgi:glycine cleavage system H protein
MANAEVKADRRYTKDHEWAKGDASEVVVGITAWAVEQLGDITLVNVDVAAGDAVEAGTAFGTVDSVKTVSDLFAPVGGTVVRLNEALEERPELINEDCWDQGWLVAIKPAEPAELEALLDAEAYRALLAEQES